VFLSFRVGFDPHASDTHKRASVLRQTHPLAYSHLHTHTNDVRMNKLCVQIM